MGLAQDIFPVRRAARLALDFGAETITLLAVDADAPQGWSALGTATLADDDFSDQIAALNALAGAQSAEHYVDLWLPADQILNRKLALENSKPWNRRAAARDAIAAQSPLSAEEINLDLAPAQNGLWAICAAEAAVVAEAGDYARKWGFTPAITTTRYADAAFAAPPDLTGRAGRVAPAVIGGGALAAAAGIAALAFILASPDPDPIAVGPDRIALAPAAALGTPTPATVETGQALRHGASDDAVLAAKPSAPQPDIALDVSPSQENDDFVAALKSPTLTASILHSLDFSRPHANGDTPIFASIAYTAPGSLSASPDMRHIAFAAQPDLPGIATTSPLRLAATPPAGLDATAPARMEGFQVAALGDSPLALRTQDFLLDGAEDAPAPATDEATAQPPADATAPPAPPDPAAGTPEDITPDDIAEEDDAPGPGSVASAPRPSKRPDSLDMSPGIGAVAAAPSAKSRPKSIKPKPLAVARNTSTAKTVRAPARRKPTGKGLANIATVKQALSLDKTSLLGVFGTSKNRRALLRMSDGRMKRVSQGEVIDGWVVSRIQATSMRMTRGSEVKNLNLIR